MRRLALFIVTIIVATILVSISLTAPAQAKPDAQARSIELNFVFLHGAGGTIGDLQLLADSITGQLPAYISTYEQANPDTTIHVDSLKRYYTSDAGIETWAVNIAESINKHFQDKENLILIGHSMGGKAALYAVAHDIGGLADKVLMVATINSPVKRMDRYYITGGASIVDYCRARWLLADRGICESVAHYDSSADGSWVAANKHWLAFISGESAPISDRLNVGGIDPMPRDMDDSNVPISAQYSEGADVVYYGEYGHSSFSTVDSVAGFIGEQILRYIFGGNMEFSVLARSDTFEHEAGWLPITNRWTNVVGDIAASSGSLVHKNESYYRWQEWEDVVGYCPTGGKRSSYQASLQKSLPPLTSIVESRWLNEDDPEDCRLYLRTRAAPRNTVQVAWSISGEGLLPAETERQRYEVEMVTGTPYADVEAVSWASDNPGDLRLQIQSKAEGPFRWLRAEWRTYINEDREVKVIDEVSGHILP